MTIPDCRDEPELTSQILGRMLDVGPATAALRMLVGHIQRESDGFDEPEAPEADCAACEGSGQVTADVLRHSLPALLREVESDLAAGEKESRTQMAMEMGAIKMQACDVCQGSGKVPA